MYTNIIHNDDICNYFLKNQQFIFNSLGNCRECRLEVFLRLLTSERGPFLHRVPSKEQGKGPPERTKRAGAVSRTEDASGAAGGCPQSVESAVLRAFEDAFNVAGCRFCAFENAFGGAGGCLAHL